MDSESKICFFFDNVNINLRGQTKLKEAIKDIFKLEKKKLDKLNYIFCSDRRLLNINQIYLNHDNYTDVITFNLSENEETIGEVYVSVDRVKDNAKKYNQAFQTELIRVIFHAALHLCGYNDKLQKDIEKMKGKEKRYLAKYLK